MGVDDLGDVLEEILCSSTKCYRIGLRLKVPVAKLDGIRKEFSDQEECLCEMLKEWLKSTAGTKPSWEVLVEALRSQTVGETRLADQLETNHCQSEGKSWKCMVVFPCTLAQYSVIVAIYPITYREFLHCVRKLSYDSTEDKN